MTLTALANRGSGSQANPMTSPGFPGPVRIGLIGKRFTPRSTAYSAAAGVPMFTAIGLVTQGTQFVRVPTIGEALGLAYLAVVVMSALSCSGIRRCSGSARIGPACSPV